MICMNLLPGGADHQCEIVIGNQYVALVGEKIRVGHGREGKEGEGKLGC